jgi:hypothetical protein
MYKLHKNLDGVECSVSKTENGVYLSIPFSLDNTDYQEYLKWVAEGNEPAPPDEPDNP